MNLRLPIVISIVAVAGGAAAVRALQPQPSPPVATFSHDIPTPMPRSRALDARADARLVVYVAGAVAHSGVYHLSARARGVDALAAAGGPTGAADLVAVNLAAPLADGDEVVVPEKGAADDATAASDGSAAHSHKRKKHHRKKRHAKHHRRAAPAYDTASDAVDSAASTDDVAATDASSADAAPSTPVDLNTADANELETLPGVGAKLAERIVAFRELNGPFNAPDDLLDVGGMTQKRLDAIEPFLVSR
jgi:competence protein ComEA